MNSQVVNKWVDSATNNRKVAQNMFSLGHFSWALFMQHLAIEKIIKAVLVQNNVEVPYIHDLWKLSKYAEIDFSAISITQKELDEITTFNLEARYEDYKFEFYKKPPRSMQNAGLLLAIPFINIYSRKFNESIRSFNCQNI